MIFERDWKEAWVDQMGLIVALSGEERFSRLQALKRNMAVTLTVEQCTELKECLRKRFTPTNGANGCQSATTAVKEAVA